MLLALGITLDAGSAVGEFKGTKEGIVADARDGDILRYTWSLKWWSHDGKCVGDVLGEDEGNWLGIWEGLLDIVHCIASD